MGKREGSSSVKRFGLTARIQIRILWERFGRVAAKRRKKKATEQEQGGLLDQGGTRTCQQADYAS